MHRRHFLQLAGAALAANTIAACAPQASARRGAGASIGNAPIGSGAIDAAMFHAMRRYVTTPFGRIACIERGSRPTADGHAGLRVVQMLEAASRSLAKRGAVVDLENQKVLA